MAVLSSIDQVANDGDLVNAQWVNSLRQRLTDTQTQLALANQQISDLKSQISQAFRVTSVTGLTVAIAGGSVKLTSGVVVVVAPSQLTLADGSSLYIYVNDSGAIASSTVRPSPALEIAKVITAGGAVTSITNYPIFEVKSVLDLTNYATVSYANTRSWEAIAYGRRNTAWNVPTTETFYTIPFETLQGSGLNTAGVFTAPAGIRNYVAHLQVRVDTTAVFSASLAVKISLFYKPSGGATVEYGILQQGESARGDITLNAENAQPIQLSGGDQLTAQIYISTGVSARVRENSIIKIWGLPS